MTFHQMKPETAARRRAERIARQEANRQDLTERILKAYREHPDREYAEDVYGTMLRERGAYPE